MLWEEDYNCFMHIIIKYAAKIFGIIFKLVGSFFTDRIIKLLFFVAGEPSICH